MEKRMINIFLAAATAAAAILAFGVRVSADTGPKPSTVIEFENMDGKTYYVTLLSETDSTGPHSAYGKWDGEEPRVNGDTEEIWRAFQSYEDTDGFYFLQVYSGFTGDGIFEWGYYPPAKFKILLYFPDSDTYIVSDEIYERYAFDSYYIVDGSKLELKDGPADASVHTVSIKNIARKNYNYGREFFSLAVRVVITVALELLVALLFRYAKKYWLRTILFTNLATQLLLNAGLNFVAYKRGPAEFVFAYVGLELLVIIAEEAIYCVMNRRASGEDRLGASLYAYPVAANIASFAAGLALARAIPGVF